MPKRSSAGSRRDLVIYMPMTGWGVPGGAVEDTEEPVEVRLADLDQRDYVIVPRAVLPPRFVFATAALAHHYAGELGIPPPSEQFFAEVTPELQTPWLDRIEPEARAIWFFRLSRLHGFAAGDQIWINVTEDGPQLVDTVAHEVAHLAGYNELQARHYGARAGAKFGGG